MKQKRRSRKATDAIRTRERSRTATAGQSRTVSGRAASYMPATQAKNQFASILEEVIQGRQVVITKHKAPKAVVISVEKYKALTEAATPSLNALTAEFDARLARMQTAAARAAMQTAFNASSDDLGRAAQQAARRRS